MSTRLHERAVSRAKAARSGRLPPSTRVSEIPRATNERTELGRGVGVARLAYLFALFYIGITVLGVSHRDLFLETPVKLPILGAEMPLRAFFVLAPVVFLISHALSLSLSALFSAQGGGFAEAFTGPGAPNGGAVRALVEAIAFCALAVAPVLLLLLVLIQFLPYHDQPITWLHRLAILADVGLVWLLWPAILERRATLRRPDPERHVALLIAGLVPIGLAFTAATFPGEWLDDLVGRRQWIPGTSAQAPGTGLQGETGWTSVHDLLFHGAIDEVGRRRKSLFSNTLVLSGFDAPMASGLADPKALDLARTTLVLRGRHLEGAVLIGADLRKADLTGALLDGASLEHADLQGATLDEAQLRRAQLVETSFRGALMKYAQLQEARLDGAQLQGAALVGAQLQKAKLKDAQLQDAALTNAQLQGASLTGARLGGATLTDAQLQLAKLDGAELMDAVLDHAQMQGASLGSTRLQGASLLAAQLQGASLDHAELQGAMLLGANLDGASLARAALQGAVLRDVWLRGASLDQAQAQGAVLDYAQLQGALLRGTQLQGASLRGATLIGTSLEQANIWRATVEGATIQAVYQAGIEDVPVAARPVPASSRTSSADAGSAKAAFAALKALIVHEIPKAQKREDVMKRIAALDPDSTAPDTDVKAALDRGRVDREIYRKVMADGLVHLACSGGEFDRDVVRGLARSNRIEEAGPFAPGIVEAVLVPACPVFATLSEADKEALDKAAKAGAAVPSDSAPSAEPQGTTANR